MSETYKIKRSYFDENHPDNSKVIKTGLTLEEAKDHCCDPNSRVVGVYFDCFTAE
jgi:hypothetical protein